MTSSPVNITIAEIRICKRCKRRVIILAYIYTFAIRLFKSSGVISRRACTALLCTQSFVVAARRCLASTLRHVTWNRGSDPANRWFISEGIRSRILWDEAATGKERS